MGARYHALVRATNTASATVPMWSAFVGANGKRFKLYHMQIGSPVTPASQAGEFAVRRTSARGTSSATFTPNPTDPADGAAQLFFDTGWSVNPTITANSDMLNPALNQQSTYQWQVGQGYEIVVPGSAAGIVLMSQSTTSAASNTFDAYLEE